jgi:hypothetical protein
MFLGQFEVLQLLYFLELQYLPFACHRLQVLWLAGAQFSSRHNISLVSQRNASLFFMQQIPYFLDILSFLSVFL